MTFHPSLRWLVPLIVVLTVGATVAGLWPGAGTPFAATSVRGEKVTVNARGLYYWDTVSSAAQTQANDAVALVLGVPLLVGSFIRARRGSLRGHLLLTGTLGFILYTYLTMCVGTAYNPLFLVYVALFSLSLFAVVLSMLSFDLHALPGRFAEALPRRGIAALLFSAAAFLTLAWLGRVVATFRPGAVPVLENTTSMFIQAMDLGIIVPLCTLSGILLLRRSAWGYLLAAVSQVKFLTLGLAVSLMAVNLARLGVPISTVELVVFPSLTVVNVVMVGFLLRNVTSAG